MHEPLSKHLSQKCKKTNKKTTHRPFCRYSMKERQFLSRVVTQAVIFELFIPNPSSSSLLDLAHEECKQQQVCSLLFWGCRPGSLSGEAPLWGRDQAAAAGFCPGSEPSSGCNQGGAGSSQQNTSCCQMPAQECPTWFHWF